MNIKIPSIIEITIKNNISINSDEEIGIALIEDETPSINKILNIFEPNTFPIAISFSPLIDAIIVVTNSGNEVATATIVNPTSLSLNPKEYAISDAELTTKLPPAIIPIIPNIIFIIQLKIFISS